MTPFESIRLAQARSAKSFWQVCREKGSAGGRKAAANKRRARLVLEAQQAEKLRQIAQGTEHLDAVFSEQDRQNIAREGQQARLRVARLALQAGRSRS